MNMSRIIGILMMLVIVVTACVREPKVTYDEIEHRSLKAWIEKYHPELMENYQEDGLRRFGRTEAEPSVCPLASPPKKSF